MEEEYKGVVRCVKSKGSWREIGREENKMSESREVLQISKVRGLNQTKKVNGNQRIDLKMGVTCLGTQPWKMIYKTALRVD